jgi:hypothetical protein
MEIETDPLIAGTKLALGAKKRMTLRQVEQRGGGHVKGSKSFWPLKSRLRVPEWIMLSSIGFSSFFLVHASMG